MLVTQTPTTSCPNATLRQEAAPVKQSTILKKQHNPVTPKFRTLKTEDLGEGGGASSPWDGTNEDTWAAGLRSFRR